MPELHIQVDYDQLKEIAFKGARRAYVFMGLGTNAARSDPPISHVLGKRQRTIIVPDEVTSETKLHFAEEFEAWVIGNGLRELIDTVSNFLTALHEANSLVLEGPTHLQRIQRDREQFDRKAVREKLSLVCRQLQQPNEHSAMIESWRKARNCLSHRMGQLSEADCDEGKDTLTLLWLGVQAEVLEPNGTVTVLAFEADEDGHFLPQGGEISFRIIERCAVINRGEALRITGHQLSEICCTVVQLVERLVFRSIEVAQAAGVSIEMRQPDLATVPEAGSSPEPTSTGP